MERGEKREKAMCQAWSRGVPVVIERIVEPGGAEDVRIDVRGEVIIIQAGGARKKGAKGGERAAEKPVGLRYRQRERL